MEEEDKRILVLVVVIMLIIAISLVVGIKVDNYKEEKMMQERTARFEQEVQLKVWYEAKGRVSEIRDIYVNYWTPKGTYYSLNEELKEITEFYGLEYPKGTNMELICNQILVQIENKIIRLWDTL